MREIKKGMRRQTQTRSPGLGIIFFIVFLDLLGFSFIIPLFPEYWHRFQLSALAVASLNACYSLAQFLFAPILGALSDKVGRKPVLFFSLLGSSAGYLLFAYASYGPPDWAPWLFVARIVDGITGGNISTAQAYIADITSPKDRSKGMGLIGAAFGLGFVLGPALGGFLGKFGIGIPALAAGIMAFSNALIVHLRLPESRRPNTPQEFTLPRTANIVRIFSSLKEPQVGWLLQIVLLHMIAFAGMENVLGLFTKDRFNFDQTANGLMFTYIGLLMALLQGGMIGPLTRRFGERNLLITGLILTTLAFLFIPLTPYPLFLLPLAFLALGNGLGNPSLQALISKSVGEDVQGRTLGLAQGLSSIGRVIGPVLGGWLFDHLGIKSPFEAGAMFVGLCLLISTQGVPLKETREP